MDIGQVLETVITVFFNILMFLILVRIILSWLPQFRYNQFADMVFSLTEPILGPFQRLIPPMGMMDLSPMVAIIVLIVAQRVLLMIVAAAFGTDIQ